MLEEWKCYSNLSQPQKNDKEYLTFSQFFLFLFLNRFGRSGEFAVVCSPTDQGYYEPDTSALIRLKMASEYGYGINPATVLTDKVNILGTGAHPFWRWLEGTCRTPAGLGKIQVSNKCLYVYGCVIEWWFLSGSNTLIEILLLLCLWPFNHCYHVCAHHSRLDSRLTLKSF